MTHDLAVVVPVLEDRGRLALLLERLATSRAPPSEIIVVSGRPNPELAKRAERAGARYLETRANRGAQLALGAEAARAGRLWFLHADAAPSAEAPSAIAEALDTGAESGCFAFRFAGPPIWQKRVLGVLVNARVRLGGIPYGDQGLFATRRAYLECGGFRAQPLFEEVALIGALRRRGTFRSLAIALEVAPERWEREGWWRRSVLNRWLALCYMCGVPAERLARRYWPEERNSDS